MRGSTKLTALLGSFLILSSPYFLVGTASAAAPKAGSICKKAGQTQSAKGVVYICKKSGKKLVWVLVPKVKKTSMPTPAPTIEVTPSASPSPSSTTSSNSQAIWNWDGNKWFTEASPPACTFPIIPNGALLDFSKVLSLIEPGQIRGGSYKPHGGLRWSSPGTYTPGVKISVPFDGVVVAAWQYLVGGIYQFGVNIENSCGIMVRLGHMRVPSTQFANILSALPAAAENDSREYQIDPPATVKAGDVIATDVGMPSPAPTDSLGAYIDFGLLDLRHVNPILGTNYSTNAEPKYSKYSLCWYQGNYLSPSDQSIAASLPIANGDPKSDYCSTY